MRTATTKAKERRTDNANFNQNNHHSPFNEWGPPYGEEGAPLLQNDKSHFYKNKRGATSHAPLHGEAYGKKV